MTDAGAILVWAEENQLTRFSRKDAQQSLRSVFPRAVDIDPALKHLEETGRLRRLPDLSTGKPGRPPSPVYDVIHTEDT